MKHFWLPDTRERYIFGTMQSLVDKVMLESENSPRMFIYVMRQIFQHLIASHKEDELIYLTTKALADGRIKENMTLEIQMRDALRLQKTNP
jgi:hypothetical protein